LARKRKSINRRIEKKGRRPFVALLVIVLLITGALFTLEKVKTRFAGKGDRPLAVERHRIPARPPEPPPVQKLMSAAVQAPADKADKKQRIAGSGTVAIVIDDMGSSLEEIRRLTAIGVPLTFAIIPGLPRVKDVAATAQGKGYQVMIHMPMEPQGYPQQRMEKNGLLLSLGEDQVRERLSQYFSAVPQAVGANNHMGSRFTEDRQKMGVVLSVLKEKGLFFIDSRTSPRSMGYSVAREMGMKAGTRDVFLDNVQEDAAIRRQLEQLAAIARKRGSAIGICHPHEATIQTLSSALPRLREQGIRFVYVSELVR
jgi:uncharacterized protein